MKTTRTTIAVILMTLLPYSPILAQTSPEERLESGIYQEQVTGDLEGAIAIFEGLVEDVPENRSVVATALLHLGSSYEKLGNMKAEEAYQRLIAEFGDQGAVVSEARIRLQNIKIKELTRGIQEQDANPSYQMILEADVPLARPMTGRQYEFSPDGEQLVYQGSDGIYVSDASGTLRRPLVLEGEGGDRWLLSYFRTGYPRWSPDGQRIAYLGSRPKPPGDDPNDFEFTIFLVSVEGGEPRRLVERLDPEPYGGLCWTPDGNGLAYLALEGVQVLNLEGKRIRQIELERHHPSTRLAGYSPDGRWLTIQLQTDLQNLNQYETDLYLLPAEGGEPIQLTFAPGYDAMPEWSRDSRSIYFASNRGENPRGSNIWRISIDPESGRPQGEPRQVTFFEDAKVMHPQMVGGGDRLSFTLARTRKTVHVAPDGMPDQARALARGTKPLLSPDGKTVYYVGEGPDRQGIYAVSADGGEAKRLTAVTPASEWKALSPDGTLLAYFADRDNIRGLFTLPAGGGEPRRLLTIDCEDCCKSVYWSPDGKWLVYTSGDGLYRIASDGGTPQKLATLHHWESWTLRWSPDGEHVAALAYKDADSNNGVFVIPAAGGEPRFLESPDEYLEGLEWYPDGQSLTYHLSRTASATYRSWLDGRPYEMFLDRPGYWDYLGRWSPNGQQFYLLSFKNNIGYVDAYDVTTETFTPFAVNAGLPAWSDDRGTVAWTTQESSTQLWLMEDFK